MKKLHRHLERAKRVERSHASGVRFLHSLRSVGMTTVLLLFFVILAQAGIHPVRAASTIVAIPPRLVLSGEPGETITAQLKVVNDSDTHQNFTVAVEDFIVYDTQGTPIPVSSTNNRWSLASWVVAPSFIPVDAHATQVVNIKINVPRTALSGGHYAMLTYRPNADIKPGELKKTASLIGQRVGTLLYFTVAGPVTESLTVTQFSVPKFSEKGPLTFEGTVNSLSDVHVAPKGSLVISDPLNSQVAEIPLEVGNVFPETSRDFTTVWDQKWGWGRYRADLNLSYGTTGAVATATIFFWLFPIRLVIYSLTALVSVLIVIILLNKRSRRHQAELEKEVHELKQEIEQLDNSHN